MESSQRRARDGRRHARRVPSDRPGPDRNRAWRPCLERVRSRARSRARGRERRPRLCRADARDGSWRRARRARCRRVALRVVEQGRARHTRGAKYPQSDRPERCVLLRDRTCRATQRAVPVPYPSETTRASRPRSARLTDARERRTRTHDFVEPSFSAPVVGHERDDTSSCFFLEKSLSGFHLARLSVPFSRGPRPAPDATPSCSLTAALFGLARVSRVSLAHSPRHSRRREFGVYAPALRGLRGGPRVFGGEGVG